MKSVRESLRPLPRRSLGVEHGIGILNGELLAWGNPTDRRLGTGEDHDGLVQYSPRKVELRGAFAVAAGWRHSFALASCAALQGTSRG